jgi:uncharacterized membrane protein
MMKLSWRVEIPQWFVMAAMFAASAWAWSQLPDRIPVHWNLQGEVDGWGSKFTGLLLLPMTAVGMYLLMLVVPLLDPGRENYRNFAKAFNVIRVLLVLYLSLIHWATLAAAFGRSVNMSTVLFLAIGILFVVLGNLMGKIRPNWLVGVRTPWTLSSRLSWDKTHRLSRWVFILMGLLFVVAAIWPLTPVFAVVFVIDALGLVWLVVYSYLVYRGDPHRVPPAGATPEGSEELR